MNHVEVFGRLFFERYKGTPNPKGGGASSIGRTCRLNHACEGSVVTLSSNDNVHLSHGLEQSPECPCEYDLTRDRS